MGFAAFGSYHTRMHWDRSVGLDFRAGFLSLSTRIVET